MHLILAVGIFIALRKQNLAGGVVNVSIVIAARNEEKNITGLINSLKSIDYPFQNFEVIIVDDNSTDDTYICIEKEIIGQSDYSLIKASGKIFPAKKGALQLGIEKAKYPFIMITDADCIIKPDWLKMFSQKFDADCDFVFGIAPLLNSGGFTGELASFESLKSSMLSFSAAALNFPYSAAARSFGFKKKSFEDVSGYKNTLETLSGDDDLLLREAIKHKMKIGTVTNNNAFVYSEAKENFKEYLGQKSRHTETSLYYSSGRQAALTAWHLINILSLLSVFMLFLNWHLALPFFVKIIVDIFFTFSVQKKLGYQFKLYKILFYQIVYELMLIVNFFNALFLKKEWK